MTTFTHQFAEGKVRTNFMGGQTGISYLSATVNLAESDVANGNIIEFFRLPEDAVVVDGYLKVDELDSGTSATLDVGHDGDTDAFLDGDTTVQSGGTVQLGSNLPLLPRDPTDPTQNDNDPFTIEEGTVISARFATGPGTAQAGKISLVIGFITMPNH
jgi:hypothetical protein